MAGLTKEEIAKIATKPKGKFRPTRTAEAIIARVQAEANPLIDEESMREAEGWFMLGHTPVGSPRIVLPPDPSKMEG